MARSVMSVCWAKFTAIVLGFSFLLMRSIKSSLCSSDERGSQIFYCDISYILSNLVIQSIQIQKQQSSMSGTRINNLNSLLYGDDDAEEDVYHELSKIRKNFDEQNLLEMEGDDENEEEDDGVDLGNGGSVAGEGNWLEGEDEAREWTHQQNAKFCFREIAGNSEQFSQSLSIYKPELLQSRGVHDNSVNLDAVTLQGVLNAKRKEEQKVNEVLSTEINDLVNNIEKQDALIKGYKKKIKDLESNIDGLKQDNKELQDRIKQYHENLSKKDELFNTLKTQYLEMLTQVEDKEIRLKDYETNAESMQKQIEKLRAVLKAYTDKDKGLMDFRSTTPTRKQEPSKSIIDTNLQIQLQKLKREKKSMESQLLFVKEDLSRKQDRFRSAEDDYKRKLTAKDKRIKELNDSAEEWKEQIQKIKKNNDNGSNSLKEKILKLQKQISMKQVAIKDLESRNKMGIDEIRKKQQKIKELLTQIGDKNKKITEMKGLLQQQQARNEIQTKLQKQRESQIDKLELEVKELKTEKFNLKRQLQNMEKPTNTEQKLKKQLEAVKKQKEKLQKQIKDLTEQINALQKQTEQKNQKLKQFKKKNDELTKKSKKTDQSQQLRQQNQALLDKMSKMSKQIIQLKKKDEANQQIANKLFILQSRLQFSREKQPEPSQLQNQYSLSQINQALQEQLQNRNCQIDSLKQLHQRQVKRITNQNRTLMDTIQRLQQQLQFKQKSLDFMHVKFVELEKQNTELKVSKNILHSSFYDQSVEHDNNEIIRSYESKIGLLEKKIDNLGKQLKQKQHQLKKIHNEKQNSAFEMNQLKQRIKDLQNMAISNEPIKKFAPESLNFEQTIEFFMKILKRVSKSSEMLKTLMKISEFREAAVNLGRTVERNLKSFS